MRAYVYLSLAMVIAGTAVVAGKLLISGLPVFLAAELGLMVSLLILLPLAVFKSRGRPKLSFKDHWLLMLQALCGVVFYRVFLFQGLRCTTAAAGGLISSAAPAFIALMAFFLLRENMPAKRMAGLTSVSLGLASVNLGSFFNDSLQAATILKGNCLVLAAVLCEAIFSIMSKSGSNSAPPLLRTALIALYAFILLLPLAGYESLSFDFKSLGPASLICIAYYGFFVSFLSYFFWFKGIAEVPAGQAAAFTGLVPVSGVFLSWAVLDEQISFSHWLALLLVAGGIGLSCSQTRDQPGPVGVKISPAKSRLFS